jgi:hypothetical protein
MKVKGVTRGTVGGQPVVVFVDDGGGYQVLLGDDPRDDPRLASTTGLG